MLCRIKTNIIPNIQIEVAIGVHIEETCSATDPVSVSHCGVLSHFLKRAIAIVVIQNVAAIIVEIDVAKAVIVIIRARNSQSHFLITDTGPGSDVCEFPVSIVAIKSVTGRRHFASLLVARRLNRSAIQEVDVQVTVCVEIEHGQTSTHALDNEELPVATVGVDEVDSGLVCNIAQDNRTAILSNALVRQTK